MSYKVGKTIMAIAELKGFSQSDLADLSGISSKTLYRYKLGLNDLKSENLLKILEILDIPFHKLLNNELEKALSTPNSSKSIGDAFEEGLLSFPNGYLKRNLTNIVLEYFKTHKDKSITLKHCYNTLKQSLR